MRLKVLKLIVMLVSLLSINIANSFAGIDSEEAVAYASFIRAIAETTYVPKEGGICGFGNDEISKIIADQNNGYMSLDNDPKKFSSCKIIYVAQGMQKGLGVEIRKFNDSNIMTIAVFEGFVESGGMVQVQIGRRNFELILNSKEIQSSGIRLSALAQGLVIN